jgi:hypothetical protein
MGKISNISGKSGPYQHIRTSTAPLWDMWLGTIVKIIKKGR